MKYTLFVLIVLVATICSKAQQTITGRVVDAKTGKPVKSASVKLARTGVETKVNVLGYFQLEVMPDDRLVVSSPEHMEMELTAPAMTFRIDLPPLPPPTSTSNLGLYLDKFGFNVDSAAASSYVVLATSPSVPGRIIASEFTMLHQPIHQTAYTDLKLLTKDGPHVSFFENGERKEKGFYEKGIRMGNWTFYYPNGHVREEGVYEIKDGPKFEYRILSCFDSTGNKTVSNGNGECLTSEGRGDYAKGAVNNGLRVGKWIGYSRNGRVAFNEEYKKGRLVSGVSFDSLGKSYSYTKLVEHQTEDFYRALAAKIHYPAGAKRLGVEGLVTIQVHVAPDMTILRSRVRHGIGQGCNEEAEKAVLSVMKMWKPDRIRGQVRPVTTEISFTIPVQFSLAEDVYWPRHIYGWTR